MRSVTRRVGSDIVVHAAPARSLNLRANGGSTLVLSMDDGVAAASATRAVCTSLYYSEQNTLLQHLLIVTFYVRPWGHNQILWRTWPNPAELSTLGKNSIEAKKTSNKDQKYLVYSLPQSLLKMYCVSIECISYKIGFVGSLIIHRDYVWHSLPIPLWIPLSAWNEIEPKDLSWFLSAHHNFLFLHSFGIFGEWYESWGHL